MKEINHSDWLLSTIPTHNCRYFLCLLFFIVMMAVGIFMIATSITEMERKNDNARNMRTQFYAILHHDATI